MVSTVKPTSGISLLEILGSIKIPGSYRLEHWAGRFSFSLSRNGEWQEIFNLKQGVTDEAVKEIHQFAKSMVEKEKWELRQSPRGRLDDGVSIFTIPNDDEEEI